MLLIGLIFKDSNNFFVSNLNREASVINWRKKSDTGLERDNRDLSEEHVPWESLKNGDQSSFEQLYKHYGRRIYHVCKKFNLTNEDAEEVIQDTFLKLWSNRTKMDLALSPNAYLYTVARSIIFNHIRRHATIAAYKNYVVAQASNIIDDAEDYILLSDLEKKLNELLDDLPPQRRSIFILSRFHKLSNGEIAKKFNLSKRTVENQLYRALKMMKTSLKHYGSNVFLLISSILLQ